MEVSDFKLPELSAKNTLAVKRYIPEQRRGLGALAKSGVGHAPSNRKTKKKSQFVAILDRGGSRIPVTDYTSQYWKSDNQAPEEVFDKVQITREIA